jgi:tetratricopeptide (TPR) repeat protein
MATKAEALHSQGLQARESGDFEKALELVAAARVEYAKEGNWAKFAETLAGDFLTYRHLFDKTARKEYLVLAKYAAKASVELAEMSGDKTALAIPLFNLAKAEETLGELSAAVDSYHGAVEALEKNPPASHNRPAVLADFKIHMTTCEYMAGDKSAYDRTLAAAEQLEQAEEMDYNKHVWLSGAHMRMASMLKSDDPTKSREHLEKARQIIESNDRLTLRKKQLEKLEKELI